MIAATGGAALPLVIQGGMGTGVSNWTLANAVSRIGQLGVVSGTVLDTILVRRLQDGDVGGHIRRAMEHFPMPEVSETVLRRYFLPDGRPAMQPYKLLPMYKQVVSTARQQITMLANFVEVYLAKEGHCNPVGINLLTKVQMPNLASLYGAMLAGVDYVLMGAGIPREIPGVLDAFSEHRAASIKLDVEDMPPGEAEYLTLDPADYWTSFPAELNRPKFLPIISANSLAASLAKKSTGRIDGFVVEGPTAGGHNAPPRGAMTLDESGQPVYGDRDAVDLEKLAQLGLPFWLAGGTGSPEGLRDAVAAGAAGIQVGTLFAYCDESGFTPDIKRRTLEGVLRDEVSVFTDPLASPTGYPFKVVDVEGVDRQDDRRTRNCDLGYLRTAVRNENGRLIYRCAAEPVDTYLKKGGELEDTKGRRCLCNALVANIGHGQERLDDGGTEMPLLTSGDDLVAMGRFLDGRTSYTASDVVDYLCSALPASEEGRVAMVASA
ncbi:MAG TPA: nitronate monooxygenase [Gemmatimonadales bacterium]|nr:nitronate monooxygenase [Gemmatimonadales bacterium]